MFPSELLHSDFMTCAFYADTRVTLFLFRNFKHFAQGRNCSVEWNLKEIDDKTSRMSG